MSNTPTPFTLSRTFKAPRDLVWRAYSEEQHLIRWFGPQGFAITHTQMDRRVGGIFHYGMKGLIGPEMWGKWTFQEIDAPHKLVVLQSFSDAQGGITRHPMAPLWPLQTLASTTLTEDGDHTVLNLTWAPFEASELELATFAASHESMHIGWTGTFDQFDTYLAGLAQSAAA